MTEAEARTHAEALRGSQAGLGELPIDALERRWVELPERDPGGSVRTHDVLAWVALYWRDTRGVEVAFADRTGELLRLVTL